MSTAEDSEPVEWRCLDVESCKLRKGAFGIIKGGMDRGTGEGFGQKQDDTFCATSLREVVVNDGHRYWLWLSLTAAKEPERLGRLQYVSQYIAACIHLGPVCACVVCRTGAVMD